MSSIQFLGALEMGLIYSFVALGIYLSFRILNFPDLTVDGSFPLGAAVCATLITMGAHPLLATGTAMAAGAVAGFMTAWISTRLKIMNLLASILTMLSLYSVNIRIMGVPNISLLGKSTIFDQAFIPIPPIITLVAIILVSVLLLYLFLRSQVGLALRATGNNSRMAQAQGINEELYIWGGISLSNALVAFGGALFAQLYFMADITLGVGTILYGLAGSFIGEALLPTRKISYSLLACLLGPILHRLIISQALNIQGFGLKASDLNLITAIIVAFAMWLPTLKQKLR